MTDTQGRYVYCIMPNTGEKNRREIGLDGRPVYTISYQDISALVHDCPLEPYQGEDEVVKEWIWTHNQVVDSAWEEADSILPMTFDCVIRPVEGRTVEETVIAWLRTEYDGFKQKLEEFKGKAELGVQILWVADAVSESVMAENEEIGRLRQEMTGKPKGMAYFYQQKIEKTLKVVLETKADEDYRRYYRRIAPYAEDCHVNKVKRPADGMQMLLNLSLLVRKDRVSGLGGELEKIHGEKGVEIRFTGPWPPYSFVSKVSTPEEEGAETHGTPG